MLKSQIVRKIKVKNIGSPLLDSLQDHYNTYRKRCQRLVCRRKNSFNILNCLEKDCLRYTKKTSRFRLVFRIYLNLSSMNHPLKELRGRHVVSIQFFVLE